MGQVDGYRGGQAPSRRRRGRVVRRKEMPLWQELPLLLVVAFCLAVLIRTFLVQAFFIPSGSMQNTLEIGDRVLVNKVVYDMRDPLRGEIVVFRGTDNWAPEVTEPVSNTFAAKLGRTRLALRNAFVPYIRGEGPNTRRPSAGRAGFRAKVRVRAAYPSTSPRS